MSVWLLPRPIAAVGRTSTSAGLRFPAKNCAKIHAGARTAQCVFSLGSRSNQNQRRSPRRMRRQARTLSSLTGTADSNGCRSDVVALVSGCGRVVGLVARHDPAGPLSAPPKGSPLVEPSQVDPWNADERNPGGFRPEDPETQGAARSDNVRSVNCGLCACPVSGDVNQGTVRTRPSVTPAASHRRSVRCQPVVQRPLLRSATVLEGARCAGPASVWPSSGPRRFCGTAPALCIHT